MGKEVLKAPPPVASDWSSAPTPLRRPLSGSEEIDRMHWRITGEARTANETYEFILRQMHGQLQTTRRPNEAKGDLLAEKEAVTPHREAVR
ncbi:hypothetical protein [Streptomyces sp. NPDC058305]|uniref:hypothetical protein n=1 Tax=Streptomyces sp. NPDC058305 TaxID=3346438 RepID=UPI0036EFA501